ncbi:hypothetical protein [uncultured Erythrobacter sp.]|uniref:hypothetical protein n=1 Tax=uncultured Erythrobacter sp. TaxID=263913 RepID=UPI00262BE74C|nr:hypothetical protein [uncultured Erythrobacter sp.]
MRLHPPSTILAVIALGAVGIVVLKPPVAQLSDERCSVARAYIQSVINDGIALEGEKPVILGPGRPRNRDIAEFLMSEDALPSHRTNPLAPLYIEQEKLAEVSVLDVCPEILVGFDRISAAKDVDQPVIAADGSYESIYFSLSIPAVSDHGDIAVLDAGFTYAGLAGGGVQVLMMKDKSGIWRIASEQGTWVS